METNGQLSFADLEAVAASCPGTHASEPDAIRATTEPGAADRAAVAALEAALSDARARADDRPALVVFAACLGQSSALSADGSTGASAPGDTSIRRARDDWLRRLQAARRSESALAAYRIAIDDLLAWSSERTRNVFEEATIVDYLAAYQLRAQPAPATYYRRFGLLRRFFRWLSRRSGLPDPFCELEPPPKPQQEADWLTESEFARLVAAATTPPRRRAGLAERDRLVLVALLQTGLRRSELISLDWSDLELESPRPSLLVRCGKGGKPRRQPLAAPLARELARLRDTQQPPADAPVFCGLEGGRLQPTILAAIIRRAAERAHLEKRVTAHTLRHSAATWLRQETGDARLVAAYLGHADLSTVSRYAHVATEELHSAAALIAAHAGIAEATAPARASC